MYTAVYCTEASLAAQTIPGHNPQLRGGIQPIRGWGAHNKTQHNTRKTSKQFSNEELQLGSEAWITMDGPKKLSE